MKLLPISLITASILVLSACGGSSENSDSQAPIVATTNAYGSLAEEIAGNHVKVKSIIDSPTQNPHEFKASTQDQLAISKAKVVIVNGNGFDDFGDQMVNASTPKPQVIRVQDYGPPGDNEHYWYDMPTMAKVADQINAQLKQIDPQNAADFDANTTKVKGELTQIEQREAAVSAKDHGMGVLITEPVPLYMLQASGFVNKTPKEFSDSVEHGNESSAAVLNETLSLATPEQVKFLAFNDQTIDSQSTKVKEKAEQNKLPIVSFTETLPKDKTYVQWMQDNISHIEQVANK